MIVRRISEVSGTDREIRTPNWVSRRILLRRDGMGFSLHETTVFAGSETPIWYRNHLEAVFCVAGEGEVELVPAGTIHHISPGTAYALDRHDQHLLRARTDMRLICVFNPPLNGAEIHDEHGVYPLVSETDTSA